MSEIDDIFSGKGFPTPVAPALSVDAKEKKRFSKSKKHKRTEHAVETSSKKAKSTVQTIVDTSDIVKKPKAHNSAKTPSHKPSTLKKNSKPPTGDDQATFRDSRGTGPRRKTEEGWSIYKEDELGIGNEGGDTPLCPFDCQCCECLVEFV
ncbi:DUF1764-domain-containing protein [Fistulina hepatica ATCC 64428]|uniref:DUF1764-domain-containing protein n=1 Tax=Fistulina hepatica ATCC 64428 TaxID=1128425 RepID=A0A0D7A6A1_9AGAR|nr:DUF1764-domain-containing protein [Fistulina hepatica ATCC 64428]